jgi:hypothetical protein
VLGEAILDVLAEIRVCGWIRGYNSVLCVLEETIMCGCVSGHNGGYKW